jgi:GntR family transcriptional regulator, sialic acid-inducible nan operon repressor
MEIVPIRRRKLVHEVLDHLLDRIRRGDFPVGSPLPSERELMALFSVGRPTVREALQALERMGFIAITHGEGARVMPLSAMSIIGPISPVASHLLATSEDLLEHLKQARVFFEVGMVRIVAECATEAGIASLHAALRDNKNSINDMTRFQATDMAFHRKIADLTGNPIYGAVSHAMLQWLNEFYRHLVWNPGAEQLVYAEHEKIYNCIAAHDPEDAARAMQEHITRANLYYQAEPTKPDAERA